MIFLVQIPSFLIFLYVLYKLSRDDYVLIRKNISQEMIFDAGFLTVLIGFLAPRILYFILVVPDSIKTINFMLSSYLIAASTFLYFMSRYKKFPTYRIYDFFTLSFLIALPFGLFVSAFFLENVLQFLVFASSFIYLVLSFLFMLFLYPRLMRNDLKEGSITIFFFILFSLITYAFLIMEKGMSLSNLVRETHIPSILILLISIFLLIKQSRR